MTSCDNGVGAMTIRHAMYQMVAILIIVPFLLFSLLIAHIYAERLENVISESLHVVARMQVTEMTNFCEQQRDSLFILGSMDVSQAAMRGQLDQDMLHYLDNMLYSRVQNMGYLNTFAIIDANHRIVACSEEHAPFAGEGITALIADMQERDFYISDILTDDQGCKMLVAIAKIEDGSAVLGYSMASINLDFYESIRKQTELWPDSTFYLLDGQQQIISAGTAEEGRSGFVTTAQEREDYNQKYNSINFAENPQGSFQYQVDGYSYISYYSDVQYTNWRVMLSVNTSNFQAQKTFYYLLAAFIIILCAFLALWIGSFASKRIIRPIKAISATLKELQAKQDYSLRIQLKRQDELGLLAEEINELIEFIETENFHKAKQQRLLQQKAEQDALTKVWNKERIAQYLADALEQHCIEQTEMAVLFVDIDDFKAFNTNYGHAVGDQVLLFITSLLARETGGAVGRLGGDEFLVIVEASEKIQALDHCLTQIEALASCQFVHRGTGQCLPIFCCIGAVHIHFADDGAKQLTFEQLIHLADTAMYQVKNSGKGGHIIIEYKSKS